MAGWEAAWAVARRSCAPRSAGASSETGRKHLVYLVESMVSEFESIWPGRIVDCKIADKVTGAKILESEPRFL